MRDPTNILIEFDKSGAEWVVVAYDSGDGNMLDVVESGRSPHTITGALISGASEELVEEENKVVGNNTDPDTIRELRDTIPDLEKEDIFLPRTMSIRQAGKKSNHGLNYDMRYKRFALENELDEGEAKRIVELYRRKAYPGITTWHERIQRQLRENRTLVNCFGRPRKFMDAWGPELMDAAYSFIPQSTVFDITRVGMVKTYEDDSNLFAGVEILEQVHDSVLIQYPANDPNAITALCHKIADDYMNPTCAYNGREFRIKTTMKMGISWGSMHEFSPNWESVKEALDRVYEAKAG